MSVQSKNAIDLLLSESFKEIAQTRPIEKITIKEITDRAGVIRPTFYNHFQDKYELLEWIVQTELIDPLDPMIDQGQLKEGVTNALSAMAKEKEFYIKAVKLEGQNSFKEILVQKVTQLILSKLHREKIEEKIIYPWLTAERTAKFFANTFCYVIIGWVESGMDVPIEDIVNIFVFLMVNSPVDMIEKLE
ncbi:MAG: TetR/AcrR family transcriptional regulator C-terminal domain-containing protein [Lachnospiraceae bacterium]|nr:TetR/AcrR family transcriptional regulator C-terminal domain-containing protein [Lachnospiraceae bacterium]